MWLDKDSYLFRDCYGVVWEGRTMCRRDIFLERIGLSLTLKVFSPESSLGEIEFCNDVDDASDIILEIRSQG